MGDSIGNVSVSSLRQTLHLENTIKVREGVQSQPLKSLTYCIYSLESLAAKHNQHYLTAVSDWFKGKNTDRFIRRECLLQNEVNSIYKGSWR